MRPKTKLSSLGYITWLGLVPTSSDRVMITSITASQTSASPHAKKLWKLHGKANRSFELAVAAPLFIVIIFQQSGSSNTIILPLPMRPFSCRLAKHVDLEDMQDSIVKIQ